VRVVDRPAAIQRDAVSRRVDVVAGVKDRSVEEVTTDIRRLISGMDFPLEYHAEVLQQSTGVEIGIGRTIGVAIVAALGSFLLFQAAFRSWRLAVVHSVALPLTLAGGVVAMLFTGRELSLGSLLGLLAVLALAVPMGMSMISDLQGADSQDLDPGRRGSAIEAAARDRLVPVLTSTLAIAALILPLVFLGARQGLEILHPLAVVLLGGLATTAFITLFALPAAYRHFAPSPARTDEELP